MTIQDILKPLCLASGVGDVVEASAVAKTFLSRYTKDIRTDSLGNVLGFLPCEKPDAPTILLEAHIDEIGFIVTHIDEQGFVYMTPCGGIDNRTLTAAEVTLLIEPPIQGIFGSTPPHLAEANEKIPTISDRGLDVGLTVDEAKKAVPIGTRGVFRAHYDTLLSNRVCAKALDNRAGVTAILYALELLKEMKQSCHIAVAFCVQEELGMRGSRVAAFEIKPDMALVTDVSFAYTPDAKRTDCGILGGGAMLGISPTLNRSMTDALQQLAKNQDIPLQLEPMGARTGTDADVIGITATGVPTALLSIPLRYMHTANEMVDLADIEAVSKLMAAFVMEGEKNCHD